MNSTTPRTYVPVLKAKEGEYTSFPVLDTKLSNTVTPLFEIVQTDESALDLELAKAAAKFGKNLKGWRRFYVDFLNLDPRVRVPSGQHPLDELFAAMRQSGLSAVPVVRFTRDAAYLAATAAIVRLDQRGICLRMTPGDFDASLPRRLDALLKAAGCVPSGVHVVIDFGAIAEANAASIAVAAEALLVSLPYLQDWKDVTFVGTAFPKTLSELPRNTEAKLPRTEWAVWQRLLAHNLPRKPGFGDYAIAHPEMVAFTPGVMTVSANIRYTSNGHWLCLKGESTKKSAGYDQYHALSAKLVRKAEYAGASFSYGDKIINDCAARRVGPGNQTTWRKVGTVHHITAVAGAIAKLP